MSDNEFTATLLRKNSLRKACLDASIAELEKAIADLNEIKEEKVAEEKAKAAAEADRLAAIKKIQDQMDKLGLAPEDIADVVGSRGGKKAKVPAKYRLIDADGTPHEWSGRGRTPKIFQERIEKGAHKEDFLIQQ